MRALIQIRSGVIVIACAMAACRGGPPADTAPVTARPAVASEVPGASPDAPTIPPGGREYRVIAERSIIEIQAFRAGTLARMGHNHVIASRHLRGWVGLSDDPARTRMLLTIPVALLTIDEPALRAGAGPEFATDVPDSAREGTRKNMLGDALLEAERFPGIELRCVGVELRGEQLVATIAAKVKSVTTQHQVPVRIERRGLEAVASGQLSLSQSSLGLAPFSVMLGALAVQDEMRVSFKIVAQAAS